MKTTLFSITIFSILAVLPKKERFSLNAIPNEINSNPIAPPAPFGIIYSKNNWPDAAISLQMETHLQHLIMAILISAAPRKTIGIIPFTLQGTRPSWKNGGLSSGLK